jgi:hypothetical protein
MSRSHWASTEPSPLATAFRGASRGARLVHRGRLEHSGLGVPRPSKRRLLRIAIAMVPLATAHAALASSVHHAPSTHHHSTIQRTAAPRSTRATGAQRITAARVRLLREMRRDSDFVRSRGSGYATVAGSPLVRALQLQLSHVGYRPGPIDGHYGPRTQASVSAFQGAYGLAIDGVAGPRTLGEITARTPALHPGAGRATGGAAPVRGLQRRLARAGYSPGAIDGVFGPRPSMPYAVTKPLTASPRTALPVPVRSRGYIHDPSHSPRATGPAGLSRRDPAHTPGIGQTCRGGPAIRRPPASRTATQRREHPATGSCRLGSPQARFYS